MSSHVAHQLADSQSPRQTGKALASPPLSSYSTYHHLPGFQPSCTHLTMTRIYDKNFDREHLIRNNMEQGLPVNFDRIGVRFCQQLKPGPRGPEMRSDKFAFLKETTLDQWKTYTPDQIAAILEQRQHLLEVCERESKGQRPFYFPSRGGRRTIQPPPGFDFPNHRKPWVPDEDDECQVKCCHRCRPTCEPRSYLSLDGIVSGDVPPSAATGFGFHRAGTRPIINARVVQNLGLRAVPWPNAKAKHPMFSSPIISESSDWSISDRSLLDFSSDILSDAGRIEIESSSSEDNLSVDNINAPFSRQHGFNNFIRPSWSPPPTPKGWEGIRLDKEGVPHFEQQPFICDGRSPTSLRSNKKIHHQVLSSIDNLVIEAPGDCSDDMDSQIDDSCPPSPRTTLIRASLTPLPPPTHAEEMVIRDTASPMMVEESEGCFHGEPLDVGDGMAVLEESVDLGVPDLISQV
ncbi:hypothetical protein F4810DRAFT_707518 [Camillea tinctor]|nr:hypothetical protein F4810DRAFT_707518 [Camillea tinctor]